MSKLTLEEKRLQQLRMQLFGKERPTPTKAKNVFTNKQASDSRQSSPTSPPTSTHQVETTFLRQDLMKVALLSTLLIGTQLVLYFLSVRGIINLSVFHVF